MSMRSVATMAAMAAFLMTSLAHAATHELTAEQKAALQEVSKACGTEVKSMCGGKRGEEAAECLRGHADKLSPGCKDAVSKFRASAQ